jgi:hypothetical protein
VFIHNLNHVSVFFLTLRLSCLPSGKPALAYPSPTYLVGLSTSSNSRFGKRKDGRKEKSRKNMFCWILTNRNLKNLNKNEGLETKE